MGNRAVVNFKACPNVGVYLHWNGGEGSIRAFLTYCKMQGYRNDDYGVARFTQVVANFFGGSLSLGIDSLECLDCDNGDNGVYIVDDWDIVDRKYECGYVDDYNQLEFLFEIDESMPKGSRLGKRKIKKLLKEGVLCHNFCMGA